MSPVFATSLHHFHVAAAQSSKVRSSCMNTVALSLITPLCPGHVATFGRYSSFRHIVAALSHVTAALCHVTASLCHAAAALCHIAVALPSCFCHSLSRRCCSIVLRVSCSHLHVPLKLNHLFCSLPRRCLLLLCCCLPPHQHLPPRCRCYLVTLSHSILAPLVVLVVI